MKTRQFTCSFLSCHRSFRCEEALIQHVLTHNLTEFNLNCAICKKEFNTKQALTEHTFTHSSKKKFRCSVAGCRKAFKQNSQLCNHRRMHRNIKEMIEQKQEEYDSTKEYLRCLTEKLIDHSFLEFSEKFNE